MVDLLLMMTYSGGRSLLIQFSAFQGFAQRSSILREKRDPASLSLVPSFRAEQKDPKAMTEWERRTFFSVPQLSMVLPYAFIV